MWFQVVALILGIAIVSFVIEVLPAFLREKARRISPLSAFPGWQQHIIPFEKLEPGEIYRTGRNNNPPLADAWALEASLRGFNVTWEHEGVLPDGWQVRVPADYRPYRKWDTFLLWP